MAATTMDCVFGVVSPSLTIVTGPVEEMLAPELFVSVTRTEAPSQPGSAMSPRTTAVTFKPESVVVTVKPFASQRAIAALPAPSLAVPSPIVAASATQVVVVANATSPTNEVWEDQTEGEAELAKILVAPDVRGRGVGRRFVGLLVQRARERGFDEIWLRVLPSNAPALACYVHAGFVRARPEEEARFNEGQPRAYVSMSLPKGR